MLCQAQLSSVCTNPPDERLRLVEVVVAVRLKLGQELAGTLKLSRNASAVSDAPHMEWQVGSGGVRARPIQLFEGSRW